MLDSFCSNFVAVVDLEGSKVGEGLEGFEVGVGELCAFGEDEGGKEG